jgi:hypothetical protein
MGQLGGLGPTFSAGSEWDFTCSYCYFKTELQRVMSMYLAIFACNNSVRQLLDACCAVHVCST